MRRFFVLFFAAATGYVSLTQEMLWMRAVSYATGGEPATFAHVLGFFLLWTLAVQPALRTLQRAPAELDRLDLQLQTMQSLATESAELRAAPPVAPDQAAAALQAATERLGERGKLSLQGDRAVLTLNGVATSALQGWMAEARSGARARPVEANLLRGAAGLSGTVVLSLGGAP